MHDLEKENKKLRASLKPKLKNLLNITPMNDISDESAVPLLAVLYEAPDEQMNIS
mgnify:CR=1 FL=1